MRAFNAVYCACSLAIAPMGAAQEVRNPKMESLLNSLSTTRIHATVARLVSFGTRNTLSETASDTRGIGAARRYLASEFGALAKASNSRLHWTLSDDARITAIHLFRRRADSVTWQRIQRFPKTGTVVLKDVPPDNEVFAVSTVDGDGNESLPAYPSKLE